MKNNPSRPVFLIGNYLTEDIFSGPEKYIKRTADLLTTVTGISLYTYRNKGVPLTQKLFGRKHITSNSRIIEIGIISLAREIVKYKPRIIHFLEFNRILLFLILLKPFLRFKIAYTIHGDVSSEDKSKKELGIFYKIKNHLAERSLIKRSSSLIGFNETLVQKLSSKYKSKSVISILTPGIDETFFHTQKNIIKLNTKLNVMFLGGFKAREESAAEFIKSIAPLSDLLNLVFVGFVFIDPKDISEKFNFESIAKKDAAAWKNKLSEADIFVSPYSKETFSFATAEAMATECVVLVDKTSYFSKFIKDGQNGYSFESTNPESSLKIISDLINNSQKRYDISHSARKSVKAWKWSTVAEVHKNLYIEL